jgi:hypothetical protein
VFENQLKKEREPMKKLLFAALLPLAACGDPPKCETLRCSVEASGARPGVAAAETTASEVSQVTSALTSEQTDSINLAWAYFGGWGAPPRTTFMDAQSCSDHWQTAPNGTSYLIRDKVQFGLVCDYTSSQDRFYDFNGMVVVPFSLNHPAPYQAPLYTTSLIQFMCYAAVRSWGYGLDAAQASCDPNLQPYVGWASWYVHDQLFPGTPYWTYWY